jgi:hypothetical protein
MRISRKWCAVSTLLMAALLSAAAPPLAAQSDPEPPWPEVSPFHWQDAANPNLTLTLTATLVAVSGEVHTWKAKAVDTTNGLLVAEIGAVIEYGEPNTVYTVTYRRYRNRWNFPPLPLTTKRIAFPTQHTDDGDIDYDTVGKLTWYATFLGGNPLDIPILAPVDVDLDLALTIAKPDPKPVGEWVSNGCNKPCSNHWKACCDVHDACYCKGGDATDRKNCDDDFKQCLQNAGMSGWKAGLYHKAVRLFGESHFNCTDPMGC